MLVENCKCGNEATVCFGQNKGCNWQDVKWSVICASCGKNTGFYDAKKEAILAWNKMQQEFKVPIKKDWLKQPHTPQKQDDYPCNVKGCTMETRQSCCGCPDYFEWEKQNKE